MPKAVKNLCPSSLPPVTTTNYTVKGTYEQINDLKTCNIFLLFSPFTSNAPPKISSNLLRHHRLPIQHPRHHSHLRCLQILPAGRYVFCGGSRTGSWDSGLMMRAIDSCACVGIGRRHLRCPDR